MGPILMNGTKLIALLMACSCATDDVTVEYVPGVIMEIICDDDIDNDGDGYTDCDDVDCDETIPHASWTGIRMAFSTGRTPILETRGGGNG